MTILSFVTLPSARRFAGNTVVADITPEVPAYQVMRKLGTMVVDAGLRENYVFLPADSYHMTVIQGINDQNRGPNRWPSALPVDATMEQADAYFAAAVNRAGLPGPVRMRFEELHTGPSCVIAHLQPADETQEKILRDFRDRVADELGHRIPGHETYHFHISLAYTRVVPEGADAERLAALKEEVDALLAAQPPFETTAPYIAYFDNMLAFSHVPIPR